MKYRIALLLLLVPCIVFASDTGIAYVNADSVNLRISPSIKAKSIKQLSECTKLRIVNIINTTDQEYRQWLNVRTESGDVGYIYSKYATTESISVFKLFAKHNFSATYNDGKILVSLNNGKRITSFDSGIPRSIETYYIDPYLLISVFDDSGTGAIYCGIYNVREKKWAATFTPGSMDNPGFESAATSGRYLVIDTGTSAGERKLHVFDTKLNAIVYNSMYFTGSISWDKDTLKFSRNAGREVKGKPTLAKPSQTYSQQILWQNGKETPTNNYTIGFEE